MVLWEILVPKTMPRNASYLYEWIEEGGDYEVKLYHHHKWDDEVRRICGGLTILRSAKGYWTNGFGNLVKEPMIPVRIACNSAQIRTIAEFTKQHYNQEKVLYYKISDEVHFI